MIAKHHDSQIFFAFILRPIVKRNTQSKSMSGQVTQEQIELFLQRYGENLANAQSLPIAAANLKEKAQKVALLAAENRQLVAENAVWAGKLAKQSKDILFWTSTLVAISAIGQAANLGFLAYSYVSRMYQLDKNKKETEKTLGIVAQGLDQLEGNAKKVAALFIFLGASSLVSAGVLITTAYRRVRSKKMKSRSRSLMIVRRRASRSKGKQKPLRVRRMSRLQLVLSHMSSQLR